MKIFFKSRYLAERLNINLAKWKRWSRDFLDPDPLGGLQSGVARQFNLKDAFKVFLGGFLVSDLKLTIPEAQKALTAIAPWLKANGYFGYESKNGNEGLKQELNQQIYLYRKANAGWGVTIRTYDELSQVHPQTKRSLTYTQHLIGTDFDPIAAGEVNSAYMIAISKLFRDFLGKIR